MKWFLYFIGLVWVGFGAGMILYTDALKNLMAGAMDDALRKPFAVVALVAGMLLFLAAGSSRYGWFVVLLGVIAVVKGVMLWFDPAGFYGRFRQWYLEQASDQALRLMGIITLVLGTALFSWVV